MTPDPPVPADGLCVVCGGERKQPKKRLYADAAAGDPFCSSVCCRLWHGVVFVSPATSDARRGGRPSEGKYKISKKKKAGNW